MTSTCQRKNRYNNTWRLQTLTYHSITIIYYPSTLTQIVGRFKAPQCRQYISEMARKLKLCYYALLGPNKPNFLVVYKM